MVTRRTALLGCSALLAAGAVRWLSGPSRAAGVFAVQHSDAEWHRLLTPDQYAVLREAGTERPFSSPLLHEARHGRFGCAGCSLPLFASDTKFDSHTGWPSFWAPLQGAVDEGRDTSFMMSRTAISCSRCGGHIGHVFADGPPPTGQRYCMNGVALSFQPTQS